MDSCPLSLHVDFFTYRFLFLLLLYISCRPSPGQGLRCIRSWTKNSMRSRCGRQTVGHGACRVVGHRAGVSSIQREMCGILLWKGPTPWYLGASSIIIFCLYARWIFRNHMLWNCDCIWALFSISWSQLSEIWIDRYNKDGTSHHVDSQPQWVLLGGATSPVAIVHA